MPKDKVDLSLSRRVIGVYFFDRILIAVNVAFWYPLGCIRLRYVVYFTWGVKMCQIWLDFMCRY
jgi:hypothetical protein